MPKSVDAIKVEVKKALKDSLSEYIGKPMDTDVIIKRTKEQLANFLTGKYNNTKNVKVTIMQDSSNPDNIIIKPENLYTALLMHGVNIPYEQTVGKTEYTTEWCTINFIDGQASITPIINTCCVTITLPNEEK